MGPPESPEIIIATSVLILGTLHGQAEAMTRLRSWGWTVYSCGHHRSGPGVEAADEFFLVDIVDVDAVAELAGSLGVDIVYSVGSDIAMPTVAEVSERLGLPHFHDLETTEILHRKVRLRSFLERHGLSPVDYRVVTGPDDLAGYGTYPAIVKPSDSQGQRGITVVMNEAEARAALPTAIAASSSSTAIVEQFLDGPEVSVHVFVVEGSVEFLLPSDRFVWDGPLTGIPSGHGIPAHFVDAPTRLELEALIRDVVDALGVLTGPLYFQLKLTADGPRIIEIASRLDGCHLWRLVEVHTGFNIMDRCFELLSGVPWSPVPAWNDDVTHVLSFHLADPSVEFHERDWADTTIDAHDGSQRGSCVYQEFQVDEGTRPRDINGVIARLGYRIDEVSSERTDPESTEAAVT